MEYKFTCSSCGQHIAVTDDLVGSQANCPSCAALLTVPAPPRTQTSLSTVFAVVAAVAAVAFAALWLQERDKPPTTVTNEVQLPGKSVEVPAELSDAQRKAIDFASRVFSAPMLTSADEALFSLNSLRVQVFLNDAVKKVVSEERIKNKFELILRQHNIPLDDKAPVALIVAYEGLWNENEVVLTYSDKLKLQQLVMIGRDGELRHGLATVWEEGGYGYAGSKVAEDSILKSTEAKAESFANRYLNSQKKSK